MMLTGCASSPPPPLNPPRADVSVDHRFGGPFAVVGSAAPTVPGAKSPAFDPANALSVDLRVVALDASPTAPLAEISPDVQLIAAVPGSSPLLAANQLTGGCRWLQGDAATKFVVGVQFGKTIRPAVMLHESIAIPSGTSARVNVIASRSLDTAGRNLFVILYSQPTVSPSDAGLQIAVGIVSTDPKTHNKRGELAILNPVKITQDVTPIVLLVPGPVAGDKDVKSIAFAMNVSRGAAATPEAISAMDTARTALQSAAATQPVSATIAVTDWPQFVAAFAGMQNPASRRASLLYATAETHAGFCEDLSLVLDDASLAQLVDAIFARTEGTRSESVDQLGWVLDSTALRYVAQLQSQNKLTPEMLSVMIRHTGQAAQNQGSIEELLRVSRNQADFDARVVAENFIYLEDSSPAARVRAFDWLTARGKAPEGYDPLASPRQRHLAIERAMDALVAKSTGAATQPSSGGQP